MYFVLGVQCDLLIGNVSSDLINIKEEKDEETPHCTQEENGHFFPAEDNKTLSSMEESPSKVICESTVDVSLIVNPAIKSEESSTDIMDRNMQNRGEKGKMFSMFEINVGDK